jgi:hypothetical protein
MAAERIDAETLAAFLDGTLHAAEREEVLRAISSDPEAYAGFVEAAAIVRETSPLPSLVVDAPRTEAESAMPARRVVRPRRALALALQAAAIAAVLVLAVRGVTNDSAPEGITLADIVGDTPITGPTTLTAIAGDAWREPPWPTVRGADDGLTDEGRAFRLGARMTALDLASQLADPMGTADAAAAVERLLRAHALGGPAALQVTTFAKRARTPTAFDRESLWATVRAAAGDERLFDAGVCLESARLASLSPSGRPIPSGSSTARHCRRVLSALASDDLAEWRAVAVAGQPLFSREPVAASGKTDSLAVTAFRLVPR